MEFTKELTLAKEIKDKEPLVSIIIPTYNEEADIKDTLERLVGLSYKNKEIIVVDDSTDNTPGIVKDYGKFGVKLFHRESNEGGRCGARNLGILEAKGDIVVILNADVLLPKGFLERILPHYRKGADYVLVQAEVANNDKLFARYVDAQSHVLYDGQDWIEWTEGFSCRKSVALDAGLFPITPVSLVSGEDGYFGEQLRKNRYKKVIDRTIVISHVAPDELKSYWRARKEKRSALPHYFLYEKPLPYLLTKEVVFTLYSFFYIALIFPIFFWVLRVQKFSPRGLRDTFPFVYSAILERLAIVSGGWNSIYILFRYISKKRKKI